MTAIHVVQYLLAVAVGATALRLIIVRKAYRDPRASVGDLVFRDEFALLITASIVFSNTFQWANGGTASAFWGMLMRAACFVWYLVHVWVFERRRIVREARRLRVYESRPPEARPR